MKQFEDFERLIPRKQIEISKKDGETANENNILKIEAKLIKDEEISKKKRIKKRLVIMSNCEKCFGSQVYNFSVISQSENVYVSYPYLDGSLIDMHVILSTKDPFFSELVIGLSDFMQKYPSELLPLSNG